MNEFDKIRKEINKIDTTLLQALAQRRELAHRIIKEKAETQRPLRDEKREEELLAQHIAMGREHGLDAHYVTRIFHEIIDDSVRSQQLYLLKDRTSEEAGVKSVGFQGIEGAYSHLASQKFFAREKISPTYHGYGTFQELVRAVESGGVDYALLPVENTTAGSINEVYDLLSEADLSIVGEEIFPVEHCLLALEDVEISNIRRVFSHPQALAQCVKFLSTLENCQREYFADTAMAVRKIKEDNDLSQAAIASEEAGRQYGLKVLKRHLADQRDNYTRFLVAAKEPRAVDSRIPCKTSLVLATVHEEGALLRALSLLHEHKLNLTKLESRPRPGVPFQYLFYLDFEGNIADDNVPAALQLLREVSAFLKILGSYPVELRSRTKPRLESVVPADAPTAKNAAPTKTAAQPKVATIAPAPDDVSLVTRQEKSTDTVINVRGVEIGGNEMVVFAGPRVVESSEQILACARHAKEGGAKILHGGCFKSPTAPDAFGALGARGLELLVEAGRQYDMPVMCEAHSPADIGPLADQADMVQIGSRNMQNYELLREAGRINRPILLKRGMMATLEDLLRSADYLLRQGNHQVLLCERGVRTFETQTANSLDLAAVPSLRSLTHLPLAVDPSPAAAHSDLVAPLALAARAVGPDGVLLEIHPDPEHGSPPQRRALTFADFSDLMAKIYSNGA